MILFFDKKTGQIFGTIAGRVHNEDGMKMSIDNGIGKENIGKMIIGWEETNETEEYDVDVEILEEVKNGLFKKKNKTVKALRNKKIEHNMDKFKLLQKFEDNGIENPLNYRVKKGKLDKIT